MTSNLSCPQDAAPIRRYIAFAGERRIGAGTLCEVAEQVKRAWDEAATTSILVFDQASSELIEVPPHGDSPVVDARREEESTMVATEPERRGPGRPKLGVIGREVTLLPRHWAWLDDQPGGASVALRKLVEFAKRENRQKDQARRSQEAVHRFMQAMTGDLPGYEEASRAFYAGDKARFDRLIQSWPRDIRDHLSTLVTTALRDDAVARASVGVS
jgi:hypothetical protein